VWTHVIADSLIAVAYLTISGTLLYRVRKGRRDLPFPWMFVAFGVFIVACGATHFMEVVTVWIPVYVLSGSIKGFTALASVATAVLLPLTIAGDISERQGADEALGEREEKFHQMADNIQEIFWMVDATSKHAIYVNPAFEHITGRTVASLLAAPLSYREIIHPDDRARALKSLDEAEKTGVLTAEFRIVRPDGTLRWVEARGFPVRDAQGKVYRLAGVVQDITERKHAGKSSRLFRMLIDQSSDAIEVIDPETLRFIDINGRACVDLGYSREELLSMSVRDIDPHIDEGMCERANAELRDTGSAIFESLHRRKDGSIFPVEVSLKQVELDRIYRVAVARDITARKRAEEALRKSEERFRLAARAGRMFAYEWDAASDTIVRSADFAQILGIDDPVETTGQPILAMVHADDRERVVAAVAALTPENPDLRISYRILRRDGTIIWVERNSRAHFDDQGRMSRIVGMVKDVTERKQAEEALRESEERLRLAAQAGKMYAFEWDVSTDVLVRSSECVNVLGATEPRTLTQQQAIERIHPEDRAKLVAAVARHTPENPTVDVTYRVLLPGKSPVWVKSSGRAFFDGGGRMVRVIGMVADVTEQKLAEEALRESEDRYRDLVEHSEDLLCTHDLEGKLLSCNPAPTRILGYDVAELLKIPMRELVAPEYREQFDQYIDRIKRKGADKGLLAVVARTGERRIWEYDNTLRTEGVHSPIVRGMAHDITKRKRAEMALRRSEEDYRMFVTQSSEGIFRQDLDAPVPIDLPEDELIHHILHDSHMAECNDAIARMYGLDSAQEFIGKRLTETLNPTDPRNIELTREYVRSGFRVLERESHEVDLRGNPKIFLNSLFGIVEEGKLQRTWGIQRDITERKRAEQALHKAQEELARVARIATLGELTASLAHEINQPLGAVVTNGSASLRWLNANPPNLDEARQAIARTIDEAQRASEVIKKTRTLLQKSSPEMLPLDVNEIIRKVLVLSGNELLCSGVMVHSELAADVLVVRGDRVQLQQVMLNLIMNAIEAMGTVVDRPRTLTIRSAKESNGVAIQVQDSGTGLTPEERERIFEPFFTTKPQGMGMGLSIARSIVEAHGGRLWVAPGISQGAVFQFTLPAQELCNERAAWHRIYRR